jgi:hypothetical protein
VQALRSNVVMSKAQEMSETTNSEKEIDGSDNMKFTMIVMMLIFIAGVLAGCLLQCCWRRLRWQAVVQLRRDYEVRAPPRVAPAAPRRTTTTTASQTTPMTGTERPQKIYVTTYGSQYHTRSDCGGLGKATTKAEKFACLTCIEQVDGDGLRQRAR